MSDTANLKGTVRRLVSGYEARVRTGDGRRRGFLLKGLGEAATEEQAHERSSLMANIARRLRRTVSAADIERLLGMVADASTEGGLQAVLAVVEKFAAGKAPAKLTERQRTTLSTLSGQWTSNELSRLYPDHVRRKATVDDDKERFAKHIEPILGGHLVASITLEDCDRMMGSLGPELRPATRRQIGQVLHRLLAMAVYPCRLRTDNPIPRGWLPKVKDDKAKEALYPDEDAALLACSAERVPLLRRLFYGFLTREGCRLSEAGALRWRDLDLARGVVNLDANKTDEPRSWALDPGVTRALSRWHARFDPEPAASDFVFAEGGVPFDFVGLADTLRADLKLAGVTRDALFQASDTRIKIRAHDLRATFVTVHLAAGKSETWISDRTGHKSSAMIHRYQRKARKLAALGLQSLVTLDVAIPEFRDASESGPTDPTADQGARNGSTSGALGSRKRLASRKRLRPRAFKIRCP